MAARKKTEDQPAEFTSEAPEPGHDKVLADNIYKNGVRYEAGMAVSALPEPLRTFVLRDDTLAVPAE